MSLRLAEVEVLAAAETVYNARRSGGGYTLPLSLTLQRLDNAVLAYLTELHTIAISKPHPEPP